MRRLLAQVEQSVYDPSATYQIRFYITGGILDDMDSVDSIYRLFPLQIGPS